MEKHRIQVTISDPNHSAVTKRKEQIQKHIRVSSQSKEDAIQKATAHYKKSGYKVHSAEHVGMVKEETILEGAYEKAEENKKSADAAKKQGDMFAHHLHMADHHDNMAEWHASKGRHGEADRHAEKSEQHHEKAMTFKEEVELDEAISVEHDRYMRSHGKKASGTGTWMFTHKRAGDVDYKNDAEVHQARGSFSDAVKSAKAWAKSKGHSTVYVMEEVELDEATPYYNKPSWIKKMSAAAKQERLARERKEKENQQPKQVKEDSMIGFKDLVEKMNLAKASMGDVIKDFQKSDAPQFAGKSDEKKRQMAIAAKLEADRAVKKEEVELDEKFINGREYASQGVMHPDHAKFHKTGNSMDFYAHGTGDKISGKVTKNDGKEVHIQADKSSGGKTHKFKVTPHLPKPVSEEVELDEAMSPQQKSDFDRMMAGAMSRVAYNAKWKKPLKSDSKVIYGKNVKEEVELEEAVESGNKGNGYHGQHDSEVADKKYSAMHAKVKKIAGEAGHLRDAKKPNVMVKHYLDSKHGRHLAGLEHDHEYIKKDFGKFKKSYKPEMHEGVDFDEEGNLMAEKKTYAQFMEQLLEYTPGPGGVTRVQGRSYGAQYHDPEGDDDADERAEKAKAAKPADAPKRGRGRPAGSYGGAYKPRSAETKAAAAAKAAATKAANKKK